MRWLCWRQSFTVEVSVVGAIVTSSMHFSRFDTCSPEHGGFRCKMRALFTRGRRRIVRGPGSLHDDGGLLRGERIRPRPLRRIKLLRYRWLVVGRASSDGRALQSSSHYEDERGMMNENGFAIIESPMIRDLDWTNVDDIRDHYLPELERILSRKLFPSRARYSCIAFGIRSSGGKQWKYHPARREVVAAAMMISQVCPPQISRCWYT